MRKLLIVLLLCVGCSPGATGPNFERGAAEICTVLAITLYEDADGLGWRVRAEQVVVDCATISFLERATPIMEIQANELLKAYTGKPVRILEPDAPAGTQPTTLTIGFVMCEAIMTGRKETDPERLSGNETIRRNRIATGIHTATTDGTVCELGVDEIALIRELIIERFSPQTLIIAPALELLGGPGDDGEQMGSDK